jgi:hypothetical protein
MAEPPLVKKQKVVKVKAPIIFKQARLGAQDTYLTVFNQEFHVHSMLLKLHSAFFGKFLGSPDKVNATMPKGFKYY